MKTKVFAISLTAVMGLSTSYNAEAWNPFKKSQSSDAPTHTERKGKITRAFRYMRQRVAFSCDSTNAGKIDGFRRCLENFLGGSVSLDKVSSVLARDSSGKPISATVNRTEYRQEWFRRWYLLNMQSAGLLTSLLKVEGDVRTATQNFEEAGGDVNTLTANLEAQDTALGNLLENPTASLPPTTLPSTGNSKLDALQEKVAALDRVRTNIVDQISDAWDSFYALNEEIAQVTGGSPQFTSNGSTTPNLTAVPAPDALSPIFMVTRNIPNSPLMDASFAASLDQFATKNKNVMANFCSNFFNVKINSEDGSGGGYEADYVRLSDTGSISSGMLSQYQTNKLANISMKCSEASMTGLLWRKLYSLCNLENQGAGIQACSDFGSSEVGTSQTQSS